MSYDLPALCTQVRRDILEMPHAAGSGHPGGSLSAVEILVSLYIDQMKLDPAKPQWADRDRMILSKGHAAPVLYSVLARRGFFDPALLPTLRQMGSPLQGHPHMEKLAGVDCSSGSLGQGRSVANGLALAAKRLGKDYRTYCLMGDGEVQEGQVWEAAMFAGNQQLDNLCVIVDHNGLQIDGPVEEVNDPMPLADKFRAFKFHVVELADGNDFDQIRAAFAEARATKGQPTAIIAETMKGKGVSFMENQVGWHGKAPNDEQFEQAMAELTAAGEEL